MPPVSRRIISPKITKNIYDLLVRSFSKANGKGEILPFISDLLTPTEQIMVSKRLAIAFLLQRKDCSYKQVASVLKVSTATVGRVNLILNTKGAGYRNVLSKILRDENLKLLLTDIYDVLSPPVGINLESKKSYRRYLKRKLKSF